jgi:hypothetical protein
MIIIEYAALALHLIGAARNRISHRLGLHAVESSWCRKCWRRY